VGPFEREVLMQKFGCALSTCFLAIGFGLSPASSAHASAFQVLHAFLDGADGATPAAPVIEDAAGNLFGVAHQGGANNDGVVFEVAAGGTETVLYSFKGGNDGYKPLAGLLEDAAGNLYGTTIYGGGTCDCGIIFKLASDGTETVLHAFAGGQDGANPQAGLIADTAGNLYGTATEGGSSGNGIVFKLAPDGKLTVLHAFTGGADGGNPQASLIMDKKGNLYGTAVGGGTNGFGTVFRLTPRGVLKVLHTFGGGKDGENPLAGVIADKAGNLYGTTRLGGENGNGCFGDGCGTIFRLAPDGTNTVLYAFAGGSDGSEPYGGVVRDGKGNLYGTTVSGGSKDQYGTAFKVAADGTFKVLHTFTGPSDGEYPEAGVIIGNSGKLYGTAYVGGSDAWGTVFELAK
jgi:uncharacterized repeat protein (TIGR03803 family)